MADEQTPTDPRAAALDAIDAIACELMGSRFGALTSRGMDLASALAVVRASDTTTDETDTTPAEFDRMWDQGVPANVAASNTTTTLGNGWLDEAPF